MTLDGRVALVTGGAKGIGRSIVEELAQGGCDVAVHYHRSRSEAEAAVSYARNMGRQAAAIQADLADARSWPNVVQQTVDALGGLDILINNASLFLEEPSPADASMDPALWEETLRVNLVAPASLCQHALPHLRQGGRGRIVNVCDISARRPWPNHLAYCVSKAGLECLTKGLARAFAPDVLVNGIAPGIISFPEDFPEGRRQKLLKKIPVGRAGTPVEVAKLVRFMVESGDYMTGEIVSLDGGRSVV